MSKQELLNFFNYLERRGFLREDLQCDPGHQVESYIAMRKDKENHSVEANEKVELEPEYVDLGLPSGTLWATCNVGANKPEEFGDYFTQEEVKKLDCIIPTEEHFVELLLNCTPVLTKKNGVDGYLFEGMNENHLFLPAAGYHNDVMSLCDAGSRGGYWSRALDGDIGISMYNLYLNGRCLTYGRCFIKDYGLSVRAIKGKEGKV